MSKKGQSVSDQRSVFSGDEEEPQSVSRGVPPSYRSRVPTVAGGRRSVGAHDNVYSDAAVAQNGSIGGVTAKQETRLLVRLRGGQELTCFVPPESTVGDLHRIAVRRSCSLGVGCTVAGTAIAMCGGYEELFSDEDKVRRVKPYFHNQYVVQLKDIDLLT